LIEYGSVNVESISSVFLFRFGLSMHLCIHIAGIDVIIAPHYLLITIVKWAKSFPRLWIKALTHPAFQTGAISLATARDGPTHPPMPTPK